MANALHELQQYPVNQIVLALVLLLVPLLSGWMIAIRMRRQLRRDLGRRATDADLTSIDTWMKVDEVEQRNETSAPYTGVAKKADDTVFGRAINRIFAGYDYKRDSEKRMRDSRTAVRRNPEQAVQNFRIGRGGPFAITIRLVGMVACVAFAVIFSAIDGAGWIPHTKVVTVTTTSWIGVGDMHCFSHRTSPPQLINSLHCIGTPDDPRDLNVTFWGRNDTKTER